MAVRRKFTSSGRRAGRSWEPEPSETRVSFIGEEIDQAIQRIQQRGAELPRVGRLAVRVATVTLKLCKHRIKSAIDCGNWGIRG